MFIYSHVDSIYTEKSPPTEHHHVSTPCCCLVSFVYLKCYGRNQRRTFCKTNPICRSRLWLRCGGLFVVGTCSAPTVQDRQRKFSACTGNFWVFFVCDRRQRESSTLCAPTPLGIFPWSRNGWFGSVPLFFTAWEDSWLCVSSWSIVGCLYRPAW